MSDDEQPAKNGHAVSVEPNMVQRTVNEVLAISSEMQHIREEITARGIPMQTVNVMAELGFHKKFDQQQSLIGTALDSAAQEFGDGAINRDALETQLCALVELEKDMALARRIAREQGMNNQALNFLTQIIRQNPGDGGVKVVNEFVAYAMACDIPFEQAAEVAARLTANTGSVLPVIERKESVSARESMQQLGRDVAIGLLIALGVMWLVV